MKKQQVTLIDVAKLAGVSRAATAKVLNGGSDKIGVSTETRERIKAAARTLNYHRNVAASVLAGGSSKLIGIFLDSFANYRSMRLLQEIEQLCSEQGYRIITSFSHDNIADMKKDYAMLQRYGVGGFVCCAHDYPQLKSEVAELFAGAQDVVFMEQPCVPDMPYISTSRLKALTDMIADALKHGCTKIGMLCGGTKAISERMLKREFAQAMALNGCEPDEKLIFEYPDGICDRRQCIELAVEKKILPYRPDFLYIDDAVHAVILRDCLSGTGVNLTIHGGNDDPLFQYVGIHSFDPQYRQIASELLKTLLHPEKQSAEPVINAVYRGFSSGKIKK